MAESNVILIDKVESVRPSLDLMTTDILLKGNRIFYIDKQEIWVYDSGGTPTCYSKAFTLDDVLKNGNVSNEEYLKLINNDDTFKMYLGSDSIMFDNEGRLVRYSNIGLDINANNSELGEDWFAFYIHPNSISGSVIISGSDGVRQAWMEYLNISSEKSIQSINSDILPDDNGNVNIDASNLYNPTTGNTISSDIDDKLSATNGGTVSGMVIFDNVTINDGDITVQSIAAHNLTSDEGNIGALSTQSLTNSGAIWTNVLNIGGQMSEVFRIIESGNSYDIEGDPQPWLNFLNVGNDGIQSVNTDIVADENGNINLNALNLPMSEDDSTSISDSFESKYDKAGGTISGDVDVDGTLTATKVLGAYYNDYAEFRKTNVNFKPGMVLQDDGREELIDSEELSPLCWIVSDTFGMAIGQNDGNCPVGVSGRVLAFVDGKVNVGDCVCASGKNNTLRKMTKEEKMEYPESILGVVLSKPNYDKWNNVNVNKRYWIKIK